MNIGQQYSMLQLFINLFSSSPTLIKHFLKEINRALYISTGPGILSDVVTAVSPEPRTPA